MRFAVFGLSANAPSSTCYTQSGTRCSCHHPQWRGRRWPVATAFVDSESDSGFHS